MNLSMINMNLLVVLDALLAEPNTTAVARKLNMSQSNVSRSLKELRIIFEDQLLVRGSLSSEMSLTSKAKTLVEPVRRLMLNARRIFDIEKFNPSSTEKQFRIGIYDTGSSVSLTATGVFTPLIRELILNCSNITLSIVDMTKPMRQEDFDRFNLDFCIAAPSPAFSSNLSSMMLQKEMRFVCTAGKNHVELKDSSLTTEILEKYPHLIVTYNPSANLEENTNIVYKQIFKDINIKNIRYFELQSLFTSILVMMDTNALCIIPEDVANIFKESGEVIIKDLPCNIFSPPIMLYWKSENDNDQASNWLKHQLLQSIENVKSSKKFYNVYFK